MISDTFSSNISVISSSSKNVTLYSDYEFQQYFLSCNLEKDVSKSSFEDSKYFSNDILSNA